jgi:hypothetical protein
VSVWQLVRRLFMGKVWWKAEIAQREAEARLAAASEREASLKGAGARLEAARESYMRALNEFEKTMRATGRSVRDDMN